MRSGLTVACALTLAVGLLAAGAAGAPQTRAHTNVSAAEEAIKSAIRYEDAAIGDSARKA